MEYFLLPIPVRASMIFIEIAIISVAINQSKDALIFLVKSRDFLFRVRIDPSRNSLRAYAPLKFAQS